MSKKKHPTAEQRASFINDMRMKQQNILWPDTLRNGRNIDRFLLKGSGHPSLVMRIGAWLIGICALLMGIAALSLTLQARMWFGTVVGIASILGGLIIFLNGFSKTRAKQKTRSNRSAREEGLGDSRR